MSTPRGQQPPAAQAGRPADAGAPAGAGQPTAAAPARMRRGPAGHGPMAMGVPGEKSMNFRASGARFLRELRPERVRIGAIVLLGAASVVLAVIGPKLLGAATDVLFTGVVGSMLPAGVSKAEAIEGLRAQGQDRIADMLSAMDVVPGQGVDFDRLGRILLVVALVYVGSFLFGWVQGRMTAGVVQRSVLRLRADVEAKLSRVPLRYVDSQPRGELLSRVTNDIDNVAQTMQQTLSQVITSVLTVVGVLAMMFWISPLLAVVALVTVPLSMVVAAMIAKRSRPRFIEQWTYTGQVNAHIEEMFTGHTLVQVFNHSDEAVETFTQRNEALYDSSRRAQFISGIIQPALGFIANLTYVIIAVVGGLRVAAGAMTLGDVQAFIQYSRQFSQPITQLASMANLLQSGVASIERVFDLLDAPEQDPDPEPAATLDRPVRGRVEFEHVAFSYRDDEPLIEDLSLVAEPGQTIAIVGPTGAGKTTLVNLVMRFYEVDAGRITLDGVDTRALTRDELRRATGMVLQDTWLFGGTIEENIAYGVDGATHEQVVAAAEATFVDRFVRTLPDGYDTVIDDEGTGVSAGEKQLLTIARAFLSDPAILILDEATSSVDTRTEVLVQHAMNALRAGRTSFVIAHRLSTIRDADTILVMEHGSIVEQGTHDDLLAAGGAYARLYQSQFAAAVTDDV
ncbi:ABC transporter ATP-binding protein [Cellulomonas persica]|uniref:Fatty acid ABC transporter ATP-binding/permease protein n=1 Tax=Cellulomonas persica TaxID=76861 RepID=A0A510V0L8_9CELL|nr:multidrug ABC transporter ATP-binding protein [Cellulomonas persica]